MDDPHNLNRFVVAQDSVYPHVVQELRAGQKQSHWMWFVFPQIAGLGHSPAAQLYAIPTLDEARAYRAHPVLGGRLVECTKILMDLENRDAQNIFGFPDYMKFCSSMTLFSHATSGERIFRDALLKYFDGEEDERTLSRLS